MRDIRNYIRQPLAVPALITLDERLVHHLLRVLRAESGDKIVLFNGDGFDYVAELVRERKDVLSAQILERRPGIAESSLKLHLAQGICRGEKMDWVVQKATELGVATLTPMTTERSEVRLHGERETRRVEHWRQVALSACEQSGRSRLPQVESPLTLAQWAAQAQSTGSLRLILDPRASQSMVDLSPHAEFAVAIGPEGGFSPAERDLLARSGAIGVRLGPRILRTETAGMAALAILQALHGDLA